MSVVDGPALLAAVVKAALSARAPRRTVAAVASAVKRALAPTKTAPVTPPTKATPERADEQPAEEKATAETSPEDLLQALRHARRAERALKKARRRESKVQTPTAPKTTTTADSNAKQELRGAAVGAIEDAAAGEGPPRPPKHTRIDERTPIPIDSGNGQPATASRATSATSQNSTNTEDRELLRQTLAEIALLPPLPNAASDPPTLDQQDRSAATNSRADSPNWRIRSPRRSQRGKLKKGGR